MKEVDFSKPVKTRGGHELVILTTAGHYPGRPVIAEVKSESGFWNVFKYGYDGKFIPGAEHEYDLVNVPEKIHREFWTNLYPKKPGATNDGFGVGWGNYGSETEALAHARPDCVKTVKVVIDTEADA